MFKVVKCTIIINLLMKKVDGVFRLTNARKRIVPKCLHYICGTFQFQFKIAEVVKSALLMKNWVVSRLTNMSS